MKYALFIGCVISVREQSYEMAAREVAKKLGLEFDDIEDFSCCGFPLKSTSMEASLAVAARNISLAAEKKEKICTLCNACTSALTEANKELTNKKVREKINKELVKIGRKFNRGTEIKHFSRILYEDIGLDAIKDKIVNDLSNLRFSIHYGCHYFRPSSLYDHFEDAENPSTVEELVASTGAQVIDYENKLDCCGGAILGVEEDIALSMAKKKLDILKLKNVDALVTICPFCSIMYGKNQNKIKSKYNVEYDIPVIYLPQLLGLAFGIDQIKLGLHLNKIKANAILEKIKVVK